MLLLYAPFFQPSLACATKIPSGTPRAFPQMKKLKAWGVPDDKNASYVTCQIGPTQNRPQVKSAPYV